MADADEDDEDFSISDMALDHAFLEPNWRISQWRTPMTTSPATFLAMSQLPFKQSNHNGNQEKRENDV